MIDSSAVVDLYIRRYPRGIFAALWSDIDELVSTGTLVTVEAVARELEIDKSTDVPNPVTSDAALARDMYQWLSNEVATVESMTGQLKTEVESYGLMVASTHAGWSSKQEAADPYVIAAAKSLECAVLSSEVRSTSTQETGRTNQIAKISSKGTKIPNVCDRLGIAHVSLVELFAAENWRY